MSGYASAARGYLRACTSVGITIRANDRSRSYSLHGKGMDENILSMYEKLKTVKVSPDCPTVQHQVPDAFFKDARSRVRIGYTIFEMTRVPHKWVEPCNSMDVIWTGSEYSRDAFVETGVRVPVRVLPHAMDVEAFSPDGPRWGIENRRSFAFLSMFDFTDRKNWRDLLRAYWTAFGAEDDVCLILKVFYGDFSDDARKDIIRRIGQYKLDIGMTGRAPVLIYAHDVPHRDLPSLYRAADCYVGISREGFGLTYSEAMACGLPTIGPAKGGNRQFMTESNSMLVNCIGTEPISADTIRMFPSFEGLEWAKYDWEHLSFLMKEMHRDSEKRKKLGAQAVADIRSNLSYEVIGNRIKELLR